MKLSWFQIVRMGLIQMCLGAIVVLTTSTLNRLMVLELGLPAILPGFLVALHYSIQLSRPNWGHKSDAGGKRTRWIIGGMAILALGGFLAAAGVPLLAANYWLGLMLSIIAYTLIGIGVGASGTSLLALLATATAPDRRAAAATITWLMMIFGIAVTATIIGKLLDPYSPALLLKLVGAVCIIATLLTTISVWGIEASVKAEREPDPTPFRENLAEVWADDRARRFTIFVFLSMTAYFMQELILEPYAGLVFGLTLGETTSLAGAQNGGVFMGMLLVGIAATGLKIGSLRNWVIAGCLGSALSLAALSFIGTAAMGTLLQPTVITLGFFNGMFAVAAIGSMMSLAGEGRAHREGTRMGFWGAAQAIAAGFGGLTGAALVDIARTQPISDATAFGTVFVLEAGLFVFAAILATKVMDRTPVGAALIAGE